MRPKQRRRPLLALLFGLALSLALAEGGLRLLDKSLGLVHPHTTKLLLRNLPDPLLRMECYPDNYSGELAPRPPLDPSQWSIQSALKTATDQPASLADKTPYCAVYKLWYTKNNTKLRGEAPKPGRPSLLVVGDSFVFGSGVPVERTLPSQLAPLLPERQVVNAGIVGTETRRQTALLSTLCTELGIDRAVVVFIANDIDLTPELQSRQGYINDLINIRYEADRGGQVTSQSGLLLLDLMKAKLGMAKVKSETLRWYLDSYDPRWNGANLQALLGSFKTLANLPSCKVALVIYPLMESLSAYPLAPVHHKVATLAREAGLPVLDLSATFAGKESQSLWVHPIDHHPNGSAHRMAAHAVAAWLRQLPGYF